MTSRAKATKEKTDKLDFFKIKNFYASKDTIKKEQKPPTEWEKIFASHTSDKGLISRIYKELLQLNYKKIIPLKWVKDLSRYVSKEDINGQ